MNYLNEQKSEKKLYLNYKIIELKHIQMNNQHNIYTIYNQLINSYMNFIIIDYINENINNSIESFHLNNNYSFSCKIIWIIISC